jgi:undecaprenyl phosphate N,N'-diacetylbacillosamine 1-phosphate transferase
MYKIYIKRFFDFTIALMVFAIFVPVLSLSIIAILTESPGNPFFKQRRVGRYGKVFEIYKLRTMTINPRRQIGQTKGSDSEVLWSGRFLRRFKIDELPQVFNVLKGDMSLVGPRPCLKITFDEMPEWAKQRICIKPGLTGLAQVNGNIELSWEQRWRYDVDYSKNITFINDLLIILKTLLIIVWGEGRFRREI